jgi:hypothetical protein
VMQMYCSNICYILVVILFQFLWYLLLFFKK